MARELSWSFALNQAPSDQTTLTKQCQSWLLFVKTQLVAAGWTVVYSSNGTTANTSDNWSTIADLVRASAGSNHSHITLKSPVGMYAGATSFDYTGDQSRMYITLDWSTSNDYQVTVRFHNAVPTGGSLTAVQTSANQITVSAWQFTRTTLATAIFHFAYESGGGFWCGVTFTGSARMTTWCSIRSCVSSSRNISNQDYPYNVVMLFPGFFDSGNGAIATAPTTGSTYLWSADGTPASNQCLLTLAAPNGAGGIGSGGNAIGDHWSGQLDDAPILVQNATMGKSGRLGRIPDLFYTGNISATQFAIDDGASPEYILIGCLWLPANAILSA